MGMLEFTTLPIDPISANPLGCNKPLPILHSLDRCLMPNTFQKIKQFSRPAGRYCTPCPENKSLQYFKHNFIKYWPIFTILSALQSPRNWQ